MDAAISRNIVDDVPEISWTEEAAPIGLDHEAHTKAKAQTLSHFQNPCMLPMYPRSPCSIRLTVAARPTKHWMVGTVPLCISNISDSFTAKHSARGNLSLGLLMLRSVYLALIRQAKVEGQSLSG